MSEIQPTINPSLLLLDSHLDRLCRLIREENVVLWVGSGFSSYAGYPTGTQLQAKIVSDLGTLPEGAPDPEFTSLQNTADYYVERKGRNGLNKLLTNNLGKEPTRCDIHSSLALINRIKYIVTTNYDPLFERAYGDKIIVVSRDEDIPESTKYPDKSILLKIHGDIFRPETIVITSEDYRKFDSDKILWSKLRSLLAEYSVVFIGYSLQDPTVEKMLHDIYARVGKSKHPYYFIGRTIDESKRKSLAAFGLNFIEMDAASAIEHISGNIIQFSYVSSHARPDLFLKSDAIFSSRGIQVDRFFTKGKLSRTSVVPIQPDIHATFNLTLTSKDKTGQKIRELEKLIKGLTCDPISIRSDDCLIEIHDAQMNGVLLIDPSMRVFQEISITPDPVRELTVDLRSVQRNLRLNNLAMKVYGSPQASKFEISDPAFTVSIRVSEGIPGGEINFRVHHIIPDIERAHIVFGLLDALMSNEIIELISSVMAKPFLIRVNAQCQSANSPSIKGLFQFYNDLQDIQHHLGVKFTLPNEISEEEQRKIRWLANFLRGRPQTLNDITITVENSEKVRENYSKGDGGIFRLKGEIWLQKTIFGQILEVPFEVTGFDTWPINTEEVDAAIKRGDEDLKIKFASKSGRLYRKFSAITTSFPLVQSTSGV